MAKERADKKSILSRYSLLFIVFVLFAAYYLLPTGASAFLGPTNSAGVGGGAVSSDASQNLGVGVSPASNARFTIKGATADSSAYGLLIKSSVGADIFSVRNDAKVVIGTTASSTMLSVAGDIWTSGTLYAAGVSAPLSGTLNAANVSSGQFGANTGEGNYYFMGNVGIGTTTPGATLDVQRTSADGATILNINGGPSTTGYRIVAQNNGANVFRVTQTGNLILDVSSNDAALIVNQTGAGYGAIFNGGNVGIGTTGPNAKLEVIGEGFFSSATANPSVLQISGSSGGTSVVAATRLGTGTYLPLAFHTGGGEKVRIDTSGNVGIGTTGPGAKLHISTATADDSVFWLSAPGTTNNFIKFASPNIGGQSNDAAYLRWQRDSNQGRRFSIHTANSAGTTIDAVMVDYTGNVGIGTTGPGYKLDVQGGQINASGGLCIAGDCKTAWSQVSAAPGGSTGYVQFNNAGAFGGDANLFWDNTNKRLGIGTTGPQAKLHVDSGSIIQAGAGGFAMYGSSGGTGLRVDINKSGGNAYLDLYDVNGVKQISFLTSGNSFINQGNVGIGTTGPGYKLDVRGGQINASGGLCIAGDCKTAWSQVSAAPGGSTGYVQFNNAGAFGGDANLFWDNTNKRLGIGITPGYTLQVAGTIRADNGVTLQSIVGSMNAQYISSGAFGSLTGGGNFTFPASLTVDTDTLFVDSVNDRVGIGTTGPGAKLHVSGGNVLLDNTYAIHIKSAAGAAQNALSLDASNVMTVGGGGSISRIDLDAAGGSAEMSIISGNVGIGTTGPNDKLEVAGNIRIHTGGTDGGRLVWRGGTGGTQEFRARVAADGHLGFFPGEGNPTTLALTQAGNVGIGTTGPGAKLDVRDNSIDSIVWGSTSQAKGTLTWSGTTARIVGSSGDLTFSASGATDAVTLKATSGNVGIGTTGPGYKLDVRGGQINASGGLCIAGDCKTAWSQVSAAPGGSTGYVQFNNAGAFGGDANLFWDNTNKRLGIGITPGYTLQVAGTIRADNGVTLQSIVGSMNAQYISSGAFGSLTGGGNFTFPASLTVDTDTLFVDSVNDRVGIGTTGPGYKLDVAGDIRAQNAWLRTTGNTGWYSDTWGGGWFMSDTGWIRTYNSKSVWTDAGLLGSNGGLTVGYGGAGSPSGGAIIAGNVGIGTTAPGAKLHVLSTGDVAHELFDTTATTNKRVRINFAQNGVQNMEIGTDYSMNNTSDLYIYNRATGQTAAYFNPGGNVWFNPAGNVGIGTTGPAQKLEVAGNIKATGATPLMWVGSGGRNYLIENYDNRLILADAGVRRVFEYDPAGWLNLAAGTNIYISSGGNVGIGTTGPGAKLHVEGGDIIIGPQYALRARYTTSNSYASSLNWYGLQLGNNGSNYIVGGRTTTGGNLTFVVNNTSDFPTVNGTIALTLNSNATANFTNAIQIDGNTVIDDGGGWHRSYGATGWYNQTYGGGWYMSDTTWIRSYGGKYVYIDSFLRADGGIASGAVGSQGAGTIYATSNIWGAAFYYTSDGRLKTDIKPAPGLAVVTKLNGVEFRWKNSGEKSYGLIAQEVEKVLPEAVITDSTGKKSLNSGVLIGPMVEAIKELNAKVDDQSEIIHKLQEEILELKNKTTN